MELRMGDKTVSHTDVGVILRGDLDSLLGYSTLPSPRTTKSSPSSTTNPSPLESRPNFHIVRIKTTFRTKPFMTIVLEVAPVEPADEIETLPAHDLSKIGICR
jgi:hypothetical protein